MSRFQTQFWHPLTLIELVGNTFAEAWRRGRRHGWRVGYVHAACHLYNFRARLLNRFSSRNRIACPCCGWRGHSWRSLDLGTFILPDAECEHCLSHERQRLLYLYLERFMPEWEGARRVLHFAPEQVIRHLVQRLAPVEIISTDFDRAVLRFAEGMRFVGDIHGLPVAANSFDLIICVHVLEHVRADLLAVAEMVRALAPGGRLVLMVPLDKSITESFEYGGPDPLIYNHLRSYSWYDFRQRLSAYPCEEIAANDFLTPDEQARHGVGMLEKIYVVRNEL